MRIKNEILEDGFEESLFDSSNIIRSLYKDLKLYLYFEHMGVYEYYPVPVDVYESFINAESQGKFFNTNIMNNKKINFIRKYKMKEIEKDVIIETIDKILYES